MAEITRTADRDGEQGDEGVAFTLTSPVRTDQLAYEISAAANLNEPVGLSAEGDPLTASVETPVVLWVMNDYINEQTILDTVQAHTPNSAWVADADAPEMTIDDVLASANAGTLSGQELSFGMAWCINQIKNLAG